MTTDYQSVVAVHIRAGDDGDEHNYGRRLTSEIIEQISKWQE